ncbi:uncharacterized protein LOC103852265 [Brassica rapa]|nr:uncharacterized protein LOC103852265 [Brassica rapa]
MSLAMDKALMALSLDEEDVPFTMPDLPEFSSAEENKLSLMGRLLNPDRQKMSTLIMKMPRKWQKEGRVRGIALSQERFQFIFKYEHDLLDILERGVQTFDDWVIVLERWVENPPEDFLQYIPLWVQMRDIPVNFYTSEALTALGDLVGKTVLVAFDPSRPITQDYIRVLVKFNVANPLRTSKVVTSKGKSSVVRFSYEKVQKRCFECQRLNHEKDLCPLIVRKRQEESKVRRERISAELEKKKRVIDEDDILFGVLEEEQVNMNSATGRCKIAKEVLEEMRRYLLADTGENREVKIDKIQRSVKLAEKDPLSQRLALRLESAPLFTSELNKGKGIVFDYLENKKDAEELSVQSNPHKLMAASFQAHSRLSLRSAPQALRLENGEDNIASEGSFCSNFPTVFKAVKVSNFAPCSSGIVKNKAAVRRRPPKSTRQRRIKVLTDQVKAPPENQREGKQLMGSKKRKCSVEEEEIKATNKAVCLKAIPNEGLPHSQ